LPNDTLNSKINSTYVWMLAYDLVYAEKKYVTIDEKTPQKFFFYKM